MPCKATNVFGFQRTKPKREAEPVQSVTHLRATHGALSGVNYSGSCSATGGQGFYVYSTSAGSLPAGLGMNSALGTISGIPIAAGTSSFTFQATDSSSPPQTASQTISNFVVGIGPLSSLSCSLPYANARAQYHGQCTAVGGQPPFTYAVRSGTLPQGLTLDSSTGVVSGVPPVPTNGSNPFTIAVTDSSVPAQTASEALAVTIFDWLPISINWPPARPASLGVPYSSSYYVMYGNFPYTASIVSGQLPPGLHIDGPVIDGTPTAMGTYAFTMQVVDSSIPPSSKQVNNVITVGPRPSENGLITVTATSGGIVTTTTLQVAVP